MSEVSVMNNPALRKAKATFTPGMKPEEVLAEYDSWSDNYDEMLKKSQYQGPAFTVEEVLRRVPREKRPETKVLDVAAGTGLVGRDLHRDGFRHIDAVEPSEGMIKKLREVGVYTNAFIECIGNGNCTVPKGGLVIIVMRVEVLENVANYKDKLEPYMKELEEKGAWRKVERRVVPNYLYETDGVVFVYCVT